MKNLKPIMLAIFFLMAINQNQNLDAQPHPDNGSGVGAGNEPVGGGAPIGCGTALMILFASAYTVVKYQKREE